MLSVRNLPHAEAHGLCALHRSRRWALLCLSLGLGLCLAFVLSAPPLRTMSLSMLAPLRMDTHRPPQPLAPPPAVPLRFVAERPFSPLLANAGPFSVALPLKPAEPEVKQEEKKKELPQHEAKTVPKVVKPVPAKAKTRTPKPRPLPANMPHTVATPHPAVSAEPERAGQAKNVGQEQGQKQGQGLDQHQETTALGVLIQAIERHKSYPRQARRSSAQGTASLLVQVAKDGKVTGCTVGQSSGHAVLDGATRQLGQRLTGLDTGVRGREMQVVVPVQYKLR